ncbi:hypothetical protein F4780DRAFT_24697 [Xylariomycetidae sp. FL0641]|nr:hypothetical protein F4780DRAFT_24697 [Xylariomycetidae sp. FL0641]
MAEVISLAASIGGLAELTGTVFKHVSKYIQSARGARDRIRDLASELRTVSGMLQNLSLLADSLCDFGATNASFGATFLRDYHSLLTNIRALVDKEQRDFHSDRKRDTVFRSLKHPFSEEKLAELLDDLGRHKQTIGLALNADTLQQLLNIGRQQESLSASVQELHNKLDRRTEVETRAEISQQRRKTLDFFLRVDPQKNLDSTLRLRQQNTGGWLISDNDVFANWQGTPNSKLWMYGIPGSGKTILCGTVIQTVLGLTNESTALAYHFCDYKNPASQTTVNMLCSIAAQLALQKEACFEILDRYFQTLHPNKGLSLQREATSDDLLARIKQMTTQYDKVFVIADAIDECGAHMRDAAQCLTRLAEDNLNLSVALFSRNEEDIRDELLGYSTIKVAADTADLELFIAVEMKRRKELSHSELDTRLKIHQALLDKAQGMFRWVVCQLDSLCMELDDHDRLEALEKFPSTLNETYDRILYRALEQSPSENARQVLRNALAWICHSGKSLPVDALCEALAFRVDRELLSTTRLKESVIMRRYSSLIRKSADEKHFELAHFSVQEYLQSIDLESPLCLFRYDELIATQTLAETSLQFVTNNTFNTTEQDGHLGGIDRYGTATSEHPFYPIAACFWPENLDFETQNLEFAKILFHPSKKPMFTLWLSTYVYHALHLTNLESLQSPELTTLHVAAAVRWPSLCEWLCETRLVDVHSDGLVGNSLRCALSGIHAIYHLDAKASHQSTREYLIWWRGLGTSNEAGHRAKFCEHTAKTVQVLLKAGSRTTDMYTPTIDREAFVAVRYSKTPSILIPFLQPGNSISEDTIAYLRSWLENSSPAEDTVLAGVLNIIRQVVSRDSGTTGHLSLLSIADASILSRPDLPLDDNLEFAASNIRDNDFGHAVLNAVKSNNIRGLRMLMNDPRFDMKVNNQTPFGPESICFAADQDNGAILEMLIDHGLDPSRRHSDHAPIHSCKVDQYGTLNILLRNGVRTTDCNDGGDTIWHIAGALNSCSIIQTLAELDENKFEALCTVNKSGNTPLSAALWAGSELSASLLCDLCPLEDKYYVSKVPILHLAAKSSSMTLFNKVRNKLRNKLNSNSGHDLPNNPLHAILPGVSQSFVRYLKDTYSINARAKDGLRPLESFLICCSTTNAKLLEPDIIDALVVPDHYGDRSGEPHVWEFFCQKAVTLWKPKDSRGDWCPSNLISIAKQMQQTGICSSYEAFESQPSYSPLIKGILALPLRTATNIRSQLGSGKCWILELLEIFLPASEPATTLDSSADALALLKEVMHDDDLVSLLLSCGLKVYLSSEYEALFEKAILCADTTAFRALVRHSISEGMQALPIPQQKALELLTAKQNDGSRPRKADEKLDFLLQQGLFNVGLEVREGIGTSETVTPAVVWVSTHRRFIMAHSLILHGADPTSRDTNGFDVAACAAMYGSIDTLRLLLSTPYRWIVSVSVDAPNNDIHEGCNLLHVASRYGQKAVIRFLLDKHLMTDLETRTAGGFTALHLAIFYQHEGCVRLLVARGASVNCRSRLGLLPVDDAITIGSLPIVEYLLDHQSEMPSRGIVLTSTPGMQDALRNRLHDWTKLSLGLSSILVASQIDSGGNVEWCKEVFGRHPWLVHHQLSNQSGISPLLWAAHCGNADFVLWLLEHGAVAERSSHSGFSSIDQCVITVAVLNQNLTERCLEPLLLNALKHEVSWVENPLNALHASIHCHNHRAFEVIIKHIEAHASRIRELMRTECSRNLTHRGGQEEALKAILHQATNLSECNRDSKFINLAGVCGNRVPLMQTKASLSMMNMLLEYGADASIRFSGNSWESITFHVAAGNLSIVSRLVSHGASLHGTIVGSLLHHAAGKGRLAMFIYLLGEGLDPYAPGINNMTPLQMAIQWDAFWPFLLHEPRLLKKPDLLGGMVMSYVTRLNKLDTPAFDRLCRRLRPHVPLFINTCLPHTSTLLCTAVERGKIGLARVLPHTSTLLCIAAERGNIGLARVLLTHGAELDMEGSEWGTALMVACRLGRLEIIRDFVRRGARISYRNDEGQMRSGIAAAHQHPRIVRWLLVDRHTDQPRLCPEPAHEGAPTGQRAGVRKAGLRLRRHETQQWGESPFDTLKRLGKMQNDCRGKAFRVEWIDTESLVPWLGQGNLQACEVVASRAGYVGVG